MKTMNEITLYDLMADDLDVWINKSKVYGLNLQIDDENGEILIDEEHVDPCAAESFASFCRSYLASYENALKREAA